MERKLQLDELEALESIFFDECEILKSGESENIQAVFTIHVELSENYVVKYKTSLATDEYSDIKVDHLPPFKLHLFLPEDYPSKHPPNFFIYCQWLTKPMLSKLCRQLDKIWGDNIGTEVIYNWIDFLKNNAMNFLGCSTELDVTALQSCHLKYVECALKQKRSKPETLNKSDNICANVEGNACKTSDFKSEANRITNKPILQSIGKKAHVHKQSGHWRNKNNFYDRNFNRQKDITCEDKFKYVYDRRAKLDWNYRVPIIEKLLHYNAEQNFIEFQRTVFVCNICFMENKGEDCIKFNDCSHVFCKNCILAYFSVKINDGMVNSIKCPETKCSAEATPFQIKSVVPPEMFSKYDKMLLYSTLHSMDQVVYCPRSLCQYPATRQNEENLVICPSCQYAFCCFCKRTYHGIEPCEMNGEEKKRLVEEYTTASNEVKEKLELRYGKFQLRTLVSNTLSQSWMVDNCKNCPKCNVPIEKSTGCNKMACWNCNIYFCWLCSSELDPANPYQHYRDKNSHCANKLFYLTNLDAEEMDDEEDVFLDEFVVDIVHEFADDLNSDDENVDYWLWV